MMTTVGLREFNADDCDRLQFLANNKKVSRYMADQFPHPYHKEDAQWWVTTGCHRGINRAILCQGELVGGCGVTRKNDERSRCALIGYWLGESYWGRGIASLALQQLTQLTFDTTDVIRLEAGIFDTNYASMRVAEKAGYRCEAIHRQAIFKNGKYFDEHLFVRLKP